MATTYQTIKLKKYLDIIEEYVAASAITPGNLVELTSAGTVQNHSTADGDVLQMFALEDELQGNEITDAYAAGDVVQVWIPVRGEIVYGRLADEQNVAIGDFLVSNGDGLLKAYTAESWESADAQSANSIYDHVIVGQVLEAQDLSGLDTSESSATTNSQWVKVRLI